MSTKPTQADLDRANLVALKYRGRAGFAYLTGTPAWRIALLKLKWWRWMLFRQRLAIHIAPWLNAVSTAADDDARHEDRDVSACAPESMSP